MSVTNEHEVSREPAGREAQSAASGRIGDVVADALLSGCSADVGQRRAEYMVDLLSLGGSDPQIAEVRQAVIERSGIEAGRVMSADNAASIAGTMIGAGTTGEMRGRAEYAADYLKQGEADPPVAALRQAVIEQAGLEAGQ